MLPESLKIPLQEHFKRLKVIHERDLSEGRGRVQMPDALEHKYPNAPKDWRWQWLFPQENRWKNTRTGEEWRHYVHETKTTVSAVLYRLYNHCFALFCLHTANCLTMEMKALPKALLGPIPSIVDLHEITRLLYR